MKTLFPQDIELLRAIAIKADIAFHRAHMLPHMTLAIENGDGEFKNIAQDYWEHHAKLPETVDRVSNALIEYGKDWTLEFAIEVLKQAARDSVATKHTITRWVIAQRKENGLRRLALPPHGMYTYETKEEAQKALDSLDTQTMHLYKLPLSVRPCECFAGDMTPVSLYVA